MNQNKKAFTLIELIIVVVIIGILALIAIPKYYTSIAKSNRSAVLATLQTLRSAMVEYYAVYGVYDTNFPIVVNLDGDDIANISNPSSTSWGYHLDPNSAWGCGTPPGAVYVYKLPESVCYYALCISNGSQKGPILCS
jgi:prepilin-type N-terminal cleavage/methylation domain-containing protein